MPWLIDGSNVLGAMRLDRHADQSKRELVRMLASFARAKKTRVTCVFDGMEPPSFARVLGSVTVVFSGDKTADEVIINRSATGRGWSVVTSDRGLGARISRREVRVVPAAQLISEMESAATVDRTSEGDWEAWFSDPENRTKF